MRGKRTASTTANVPRGRSRRTRRRRKQFPYRLGVMREQAMEILRTPRLMPSLVTKHALERFARGGFTTETVNEFDKDGKLISATARTRFTK